MIRFKQFITFTSVAVLAVAMVPWANANAVATVLIDPYDNIVKDGTSYLKVTGAGLVPNATIEVEQRSMAPYSEAEGDTETGSKVEFDYATTLLVDENGTVAALVPVRYDIIVDSGMNMDYCDSIVSLNRTCTLLLRYADGPSGGDEILLQKLYFGMADPTKVTPPVATAPVIKDDCKENKWSTFAGLNFKNQGACVSYVASRSQ